MTPTNIILSSLKYIMYQQADDRKLALIIILILILRQSLNIQCNEKDVISHYIKSMGQIKNLSP